MRPWLFLDVDGVAAPVPPAELDDRCPPPGYRSWPSAMWSVYVHEHLDQWARELNASFEVIWTTDWQHNAPAEIGKPAGLPDWPYLQLDYTDRKRMRHKLGHKIAAIIDKLRVEPRPFAWIDDDLRAGGPKRILEISLPKLLIKPDTRVGITREHIDQLLAFAADPARPPALPCG
jgi:hypothetical protein